MDLVGISIILSAGMPLLILLNAIIKRLNFQKIVFYDFCSYLDRFFADPKADPWSREIVWQ